MPRTRKSIGPTAGGKIPRPREGGSNKVGGIVSSWLFLLFSLRPSRGSIDAMQVEGTGENESFLAMVGRRSSEAENEKGSVPVPTYRTGTGTVPVW